MLLIPLVFLLDLHAHSICCIQSFGTRWKIFLGIIKWSFTYYVHKSNQYSHYVNSINQKAIVHNS